MIRLIETSQTGRVLHVTLNRPEKRNALNTEMCHQLAEALDGGNEDDSVGAMVMSGNGAAFCAGMDLREAPGTDRAQIAGLHERLFTLINRVRKPVIAAVHGPAIAGGTGLAANAHIVVASPGASFGLTEIRVGLWPVLVFRACELALGERRSTELSITGRVFTAAEAMTYGLVTEIHEEPLVRAMEIAGPVSKYSPVAMGLGLDYVHHIRIRNWDQAGRIGHRMRDRLMEHADFAEGVEAFHQRRNPEWPSLKKGTDKA